MVARKAQLDPRMITECAWCRKQYLINAHNIGKTHECTHCGREGRAYGVFPKIVDKKQNQETKRRTGRTPIERHVPADYFVGLVLLGGAAFWSFIGYAVFLLIFK